MEENTTGVNVQEAAAPAESVEVESVNQPAPAAESAPGEAAGAVEDSGAATEQPTQTKEENAAFAAMRRRAEQAERDRDAAKQQVDQLSRHAEGYSKLRSTVEGALQTTLPDDPDSAVDAFNAAQWGVTADEARTRRLANEAAQRKELERNPAYQQLLNEKKALEEKANEAERRMVLAAIQKDVDAIANAFPDARIQNIGDMDEDTRDAYVALMRTRKYQGKPVEAYALVTGRTVPGKKTAPPSTGAIKNTVVEQPKDFYTPEEVDKLTDADYRRNPKLLDIIQKSMTKWR